MAQLRTVTWPVSISQMKKIIRFAEANEIEALSQVDIRVGVEWINGDKDDEEFLEQLLGGPGQHWRNRNGDEDEDEE